MYCTGEIPRRKTVGLPRMAELKSRNREHINKLSATWRAENPGKVKTSKAAWRAANIDKVKAYQIEWRKRNPDKIKANHVEWRKKRNPDKKKIYTQNRRARKNNNGGNLSSNIVSVLFALQRGKCVVCKKSLKKVGFHLDHIIPLSKGGRNEDKNIQLTCPTCNMKKGGKDPIQFMQENGYLL
jgi:5-methylcytosine-specific restriction endonuclease McrA